MNHIDKLIQLLARMPGLGPRSARRAVLHLLNKRESLMRPLAEAMINAADDIKNCNICGNIDMVDPCNICQNKKRDNSIICVVEQVGDLWALERTGTFKGYYHILGGVLSALDGLGPEDINIASLISRVANVDTITEVILATNLTVDGQVTAHYINERLEQYKVKVTLLAHGVPIGGELDYLDDGTLTAALKARRAMDI